MTITPTFWQLTTPDPVDIGTDDLTFAPVYGAQQQATIPVYAVSAAETAAGIVEGITIGTVVDTSITWGNVRRYGADPTGSADSHDAIQAAINQASHYGEPVYCPNGEYKLDDAVRFYYEGTDNPGFLNASRRDGRLRFSGAFGARDSEARNRDRVGTVFNYTPATGNAFEIGNPAATPNTQGIVLEHFSVWAATTGWAMAIFTLSGGSLRHLGLLNDGADLTNGGGLYMDSCFSTIFDHVNCIGPIPRGSSPYEGGYNATHGRGWYHPVITGGGGANTMNVCNSGGFEVGFEFGHEYDAGNTNQISAFTMTGCEGAFNRINFWFRHGCQGAELLNCWSERCTDEPSAITHDMKFTDSCGIGEDTMNSFLIKKCLCSAAESVTGSSAFEIGQDTGDINQDRAGNIWFLSTGCRSGADIKWRRYNVRGQGYLRIEDARLNFNSANDGIVRIDADEPQHAPIQVIGIDGWRPHRYVIWCEEDSAGASMYSKHFVGDADFCSLDQDITSHEIDFTSVRELPPLIRVAPDTGETVTITLPSDSYTASTMKTRIVKETSTTGIVKIDADPAPLWQQPYTYSRFDKVRNSSGVVYYAENDGETDDPGQEPVHTSGIVTHNGIVWRFLTNDDTPEINGAATVSFTGAPDQAVIDVYGGYSKSSLPETWVAIKTSV